MNEIKIGTNEWSKIAVPNIYMLMSSMTGSDDKS